ncbi:hypothetical protein GCM10011390_38810 [Aureimonas endophytica]|uniref:Rhamnosyltransferase n=1 Tax=Aureimonas endophytica TaxID=2027858 RepID=A0A917EAV2_9HYPH|nr:glycosyltransferase [Aureimonas endophytica]GGE15962.1 hypothetical protein GCM10011390_38810 [Aureimonas endophytica]
MSAAVETKDAAKATIAVAITVYRPDGLALEALAARFLAAGYPVYLHVDGPVGEAIEATDLARLRALAGARIALAPRNAGIGAGLNRLAEAAERDGCNRVLFFDQDSLPAPDLPERLLQAFRELEGLGLRPAVVGPRPVSPPGGGSKPPRYRRRDGVASVGACRPVDYVITSGSLVSLAAWHEIGAFAERYRMDAIDVEWGFRAWRRGRSVWVLDTAEMPHQIGSGILRWGPIAFPDQNPARMRTYVRNQFDMLRLAHVPLGWKLRTLVYVPLQAAVYAAKSGHGKRRAGLDLLRAAFEGLGGR